MTSSPILEFFKRQRSLALKPCYWSPGYVWINMSPGWGIIPCQESHSAASSLLAIVTKGNQRNNPRIAWKNFGTCNIDHLKLLRIVMPGISPRTILSSPLKTLAGPVSRTTGRGRGTIILCHPALTKLSAVTMMTLPACPTLVLPVINMPAVVMDWPLDLHFTKSSQSCWNIHTFGYRILWK